MITYPASSRLAVEIDRAAIIDFGTMADLSNLYQQNLLMGPLSAEQRNLLMNAWLSNNPPHKQQQQPQQQQQSQRSSSATAQAPPTSVPVTHSRSGSSNGIGAGANGGYFESPVPDAPGSGHLGFASDDSPFLDFDPEADFDFNSNVASMIGDLPEFEQQSNLEPQPNNDHGTGNEHEPGDKRKSMDGREGEQQPDSGKKRQGEGQEKVPKKPGRKPLTNEPTSVSGARPSNSCQSRVVANSCELETQGTEPCRAARLSGAQGKASPGSGGEGGGTRKGLPIREPGEHHAARTG